MVRTTRAGRGPEGARPGGAGLSKGGARRPLPTDLAYALDRAAIVAATDRSGSMTYVNDRFCEISKYPREELLGRNPRILGSGRHPPPFFADLWRTIEGGHLWHGEIQNRAKDGSHYWVETTIVPCLDGRERPSRYIAVQHDITRCKELERELRGQASLTRLGEMAAVVAHELKNPLAGLRGALEVIGRRMPPESTDRRIIGEMVARIDSLDQMMQNLLVFARPVEPRRAPVSIGRIVADTVDLLRTDPEMRGVTVEVSGPSPTLTVDANLITGMVLNLLINAAQAMGRNGRIAVSTVEADGWCDVRVADTGPGIPREIREKVFEPFFTTKHRGTGLGLAVARRTAELHGGRLSCESPPEGGTVMVATLPLASRP